MDTPDPRPMWRCNRCGFPENLLDECANCEAPRDWEYDGPDEIGDTTGDSPRVRAEAQDRARRVR